MRRRPETPTCPGSALRIRVKIPKIGPKMAKNQVFDFSREVSTFYRRATGLEVVSFERGDLPGVPLLRALFRQSAPFSRYKPAKFENFPKIENFDRPD